MDDQIAIVQFFFCTWFFSSFFLLFFTFWPFVLLATLSWLGKRSVIFSWKHFDNGWCFFFGRLLVFIFGFVGMGNKGGRIFAQQMTCLSGHSCMQGKLDSRDNDLGIKMVTALSL
ncbi:hypothetical protein B0T19DRAFT_431512 [Cercophora scortea]|uniref:Transmembrane protein n=1 Tax=Cercophora scortea TaxID=314031 RepID=A0AAE0M7T1_9PEZI|nr:hypothetical protein B0T19DRAFT_431512 [Cercophora scortea]